MSVNFSSGSTETVNKYLTNDAGNAILARCTVANIPTGAGYAVGCLIQATDTGNSYVNTGSITAATFTLLDSTAASLALPTAATDSATTTTTSLALTQNTVTSGAGLTQSLNGLTTGFGNSITHTTSVIASGGSLLNLSSTGIDTGTTTGNLLNLSSTASLAGTIALITSSGTTTGKVLSIVAAAQTTGDAISITTASATTGGGLTITSPSSNLIAVGRQGQTAPAFQVDGSTATSATGIKIKSAAAAGGVAVSAITSGTNENLTIDAAGSGTIAIGTTSTGEVQLNRGARKALVVGTTLVALSAQNVTPSAANLIGGYVKHVSATGAGTFTLDTGTNISAAIPGVAVGDSFQCMMVNSGSQTSTITTGASGTTLFGTAAVTTGKTALMTFYNTGSNAWDVYINASA